MGFFERLIYVFHDDVDTLLMYSRWSRCCSRIVMLRFPYVASATTQGI